MTVMTIMYDFDPVMIFPGVTPTMPIKMGHDHVGLLMACFWLFPFTASGVSMADGLLDGLGGCPLPFSLVFLVLATMIYDRMAMGED